MSWLLIAVIAQFILGTAAVFDKLLLKRWFFDPWLYTFWSSLLGLAVLVAVPFGFESMPAHLLLLAFFSGAFFSAATYFFFLALKRGQASAVQLSIIAFAEVATLGASLWLPGNGIGVFETFGFILLFLGALIFLTAEEKGSRISLSLEALASAALFGVSNVLLKLSFEGGSFLTGLVLMRLGAFLAISLPLVLPSFRASLLSPRTATEVRHRLWYLANRAYSAAGALLVQFAIFLAHPALVEATSSVRVLITFVFAGVLLKEAFRGRALLMKSSAGVFVIGGIFLFGLSGYAESLPIRQDRPVSFGVTFSAKFSRELGLDPHETLAAILEDLGASNVRLAAYWDEIEKTRGEYDFSGLDWQIADVERAGASAILAIGMKTPRWPECHLPPWAKILDPEEREEALGEYLREIVVRYRNERAIKIWQVENEPFLLFGECPGRGKNFLDREITRVKSLDQSRPILVTDGGEFGDWYRASSRGDIFGTTMYRKVYPRFIGPLLGPIEYPLDPGYFLLKEKIIRSLIPDAGKRFIVVELQAEPWGTRPLDELPLEEQLHLFSSEYFSETLHYALSAGFEEYYLWGAEWWYWLKKTRGDNRMWERARKLFESKRMQENSLSPSAI
jgi:uncharacterized membrane protein